MGAHMNRFLVFVLLMATTALGSQISTSQAPSDQSPPVTFNKDVLPILQDNCQTCHRPGEVAPISFLTYESTRPWAKAIKAAVLSKKMPPWLADPHYGGFRNAPQLTEADIKTLAAWADTGAHEGNPADKPEPIQFFDGWRIKPDVIVSMPVAYSIGAKGAGEIKEFFVENPFKQDTWVSSIEIRPGDPSVVHHVIVQVQEQSSAKGFAWGALNCAPALETLIPLRGRIPAAGRDTRGGGGGYGSKGADRATEASFTTMDAVYAPGSPPLDFRFHNSAKLIRSGKPIRIEVHYTPNGKATTDQTRIGFTLAKGPAQRRFVMMAPTSLVDRGKPIPAGAQNFETTGELTFRQDAELVWFMPHMHLRGKDMTFRLVYPNGLSDTVLSAKFDFQWQLGYEVEEPIKIPKGTKMIIIAHHDNSANNRLNPAPDKEVRWGELTSDEMMLPWFGVVVKQDAEPAMIASYKPGGTTDEESPLPKLRLPTPPFASNGSPLGVIPSLIKLDKIK
jgi:mono/diheme cytochrome c family protein